jgi:hypothetical protein
MEMGAMAEEIAVKATMRPTRKTFCRMRDTARTLEEREHLLLHVQS